MIFVGIFLLLLFGKIKAQFPSSSTGCSGYMFLGEYSTTTCNQFITFLQGARDTVGYLADYNGFAHRGFGDPEVWLSLHYMNKANFTLSINDWINYYSNHGCGDLESVNYISPLQDILNNLNVGYSGYGIFLTGETDTIVDLSSAMDLAQQIAAYNPDIYVWDVSVYNNNNTLFETLTGGKPGHILRGADLTYNDVMNFLSCSMISEFIYSSCNIQSYPPTPASECPSTTTGPPATPPTTNTSCTSLELIFILERSESIVPYIYEGNVSQFVIDLASQFSFPNEVSSGSGYARFGVIQYATTPEISIPLGSYTRNDFNSQVQQKVKIGDGGVNNVADALLAAYNQFQSNSVLSNRAIILVVDDVPLDGDAVDAMHKVQTLVQLPMGAIIPGFAGSPADGLKDLKTLLGTNSNLAFPDLTTALSRAPGFVMDVFPCQAPPVCSVLSFIGEATAAIGNKAKVDFLKLAQRLINSVNFNPKQRFSIALFGDSIYKAIEPQQLQKFNSTLSSFIQIMTSDDSPNGGRTFLAPILNQYVTIVNSGLYKNFSNLLLAEVEAIRDPADAYSACQTVASLGTDFYVIDQSRFTGPSSLFSTCTGGMSGHILNGTSLSQDDLFNQLRDSLIRNFNFMRC